MTEPFLTHLAIQHSIRRLRRERGLTLRGLAHAAQVKPAAISQIERGQNTDPRAHSNRPTA